MRCRPRFAQRVFETVYWGKPAILKQRFEKKYRHPTLDAKLTKQRLSMEVRGMLKARKLGLCTPGVLLVAKGVSELDPELCGAADGRVVERAAGWTCNSALKGALPPS